MASKTWLGFQALTVVKSNAYYAFFLWPLLLLFAPSLSLAARDKEMRVVLIGTALMTAGMFLEIWPPHGHYAAPAAGAILLFLLNALRHLRKAGKSPWCPALTRAIVLTLAVWMIVPICERLRNPHNLYSDYVGIQEEITRETLQSKLSRLPGKHLIIVHYRLHDVPGQDWVFNRADIDNSKIVWARDMGEEANKELLHYYSNRQIWYVDRGDGIATPVPYIFAMALKDPADIGDFQPEPVMRAGLHQTTSSTSAR